MHAGIHTPLGVGLEDPSTSPLGVVLETAPLARPLNSPPPGCGPGNLQGMLGYQPPLRPVAGHAGIPPAMHAEIPPPPPRGQNDRHV